MAIAMRGLKVKPTYEDLIGVAKPYGLEHRANSLIEMQSSLEKDLFYHN